MRRVTRRESLLLTAGLCISGVLAGCGATTARGGLYIAEPGGAPRWIDETTGAPAWSPDNQVLAWGDEDGLRIWNRSSGDVSLLTRIPVVGRPAWSPDSSAIGFLDSQARVLQKIEIASGAITFLADLSEGIDGAIRAPIVTRGGPAWSPDGSRMAFICWDGQGDELCVVGSTGSVKQQVTTIAPAGSASGGAARSSVTSVAWSPDSEALAVAVYPEQSGATSGVFRIELAARSGRRLTKVTANAPLIWEPSSNDLIFSAMVEGRNDVFRQPVDGGKMTAITSGLSEGAREPAIDSAGDLAAISGDRVVLLRPDSADVTFFEVPALASLAPALSPDGRQVAFLALPRPIQGYP